MPAVFLIHTNGRPALTVFLIHTNGRPCITVFLIHTNGMPGLGSKTRATDPSGQVAEVAHSVVKYSTLQLGMKNAIGETWWLNG